MAQDKTQQTTEDAVTPDRTADPGELEDQELDKVSGGTSLSLNFAKIEWTYQQQSN